MGEAVLKSVKNRVKAELSFTTENCEEIRSGFNNRIFILTSSDNNKLLLKIYNPHDNKRGLQREFQALSFLNRENFHRIPKAYLKDDTLNYAIYSFESGTAKSAKELSRDDLDQMISFIISLQNIKPSEVKEEFLPGIKACFSFQNYINNINSRIAEFNNDAERVGLPEMVKELLQSDFVEVIGGLVKTATERYSEDEITAPIPLEDRRLSPVDFGPHNSIYKDDGSVVFVDFEYFGWDDPNRLVGDFLNHDQTLDVSLEDKDYFSNSYLKASTLPQVILDRLETVRQLDAIEWLTVYLSSLTSKSISIRKFADSNFEETKYISTQVDKYKSRLAALQNT